MIIRVFQITINSEYRKEFERDFRTISVDTVQNHKGLISCQIAGPTKWNPDDYAMITYWEDEDSLEAFAGQNWNQVVIPPGMEKYPRASSVAHYKNDELG